MPRPKPELQYAQRPPNLRRRARWAFILAAILIAAGIVLVNRQALTETVRLAYYQRQAMNYEAPPSQLVIESDPEKAQHLVATDSSYQMYLSGARPAMRGAPPWRFLRRFFTQTVEASAPATLFLHERKTPTGNDRLIVVTAYCDPSWHTARLLVEWYCVEPAHFTSQFQRLSGGKWSLNASKGCFHLNELRIFAGQVDPKNASDFTIAYQYRGSNGTIDGHIEDDFVQLSVRDGPLK